MSGNDLISPLRAGPDNSRNQYPIIFYAFRRFLHMVIIYYPKRMIFEGVKFRKWDFNDLLLKGISPGFICGKNVIV